MTIQLIPAIDLKQGKCVRLKQGRMEASTIFSHNPSDTAQHWYDEGARRLHIVDLDGAFAGTPKNQTHIETICALQADYTIQIGGGIRDLATIEHYLNSGANYCIIGSQAAKNPKFVTQACQEFPQQIIVGIDAKDGFVAVQGWAEITTIKASSLAKQFASVGVAAIIFTDISRDGMLNGLNLPATNQLALDSNIPIIASGGLASMQDIENLAELDKSGNHGIVAAITGRAIYDSNSHILILVHVPSCAVA